MTRWIETTDWGEEYEVVDADDYDALEARYAALVETCRAAIKAGDWKVDGARDPDL
jgi:hypothetical protein